MNSLLKNLMPKAVSAKLSSSYKLTPNAYNLEARSCKLKANSGFSTIEILVAMTILVLCLTAVVVVAAGSQSLLTDSQVSREALGLAQGLLEKAQADARKDFKLVVPSYEEKSFGSVTYNTTLEVHTSSDYLSKTVTALVEWDGQFGRKLNVTLSGIVTNFNNLTAADTCSSAITEDVALWKTPQIKNMTRAIATLGEVSGNYPITDLDVYNGRLYVTIGQTGTATDPTLFIFDISDPSNPDLLSKIDNANDTVVGLAAVVVNKGFAYVATRRNDNADPDFGQLQVFDISNPVTPTLVNTTEVPGNIGNSIAYKDGYIYLGLTTGGANLRILDVHSPSTPILRGNYSIANDINTISLNGKHAFIATPNANELTILDITNPNAPSLEALYNAAGGGNGKTIYTVGDTVYMGRTVPSSGPELLALDVTDFSNILTSTTGENTTSVDSIIWRAGLEKPMGIAPIPHSLVFALTRDMFQIWDHTTAFTPWSTDGTTNTFLLLPDSSASIYEPTMDCEGNTFFTGVNDGSNNGFVYSIAP